MSVRCRRDDESCPLSTRTEVSMEQLGLGRHPPNSRTNYRWDYASLTNPPVILGEKPWAASIYRGLVPAKNILNRDFAVNGAMVICSIERGENKAAAHHCYTLAHSFLRITHTCVRCLPIGSPGTFDVMRCSFRRALKRRWKLPSKMEHGCDDVTRIL